MKKYRIYQVDAFTKEKLYGNPAGVVANADGLTDAQMQQIAREFNLSETAFILQGKKDAYDVEVRFFTPTREVPICGHATIAAHYVLATENQFNDQRIVQKTKAGILPVDIKRREDDYEIVMTQGKIEMGEALDEKMVERIAAAMGLEKKDLREDCPVQIASTGHSKVMLGMGGIWSKEVLNNLTPNFEELSTISREINCNGYYVFTLDPDEEIMVHGRMFAPASGINEDPVTGNANGSLGAYLAVNGFADESKPEFCFSAMQGEAINRRGTMQVIVSLDSGRPKQVQIVGKAVIAFKAELEL